ncbi:MAG: ATP-binding protein [Sphingobacteriales bacterium]|nr:ATP-binding protein [Sphingobacteriales bacterium]
MYNSSEQGIIVFVAIASALILAMAVFISYIIYRYQQKQNKYYNELENLKIMHENDILQSQIEIQEQTFQHISKEIHDNIGQKLTLAKLHLNTLYLANEKRTDSQIKDAVTMISESIIGLRDISRSLSSESILNNGLEKALEYEFEHLQRSGLYAISFEVTGKTIFLNGQHELVLFRIVQEAINNIIKHALASKIDILLHFEAHELSLQIKDNGRGFSTELNHPRGNGISNMKRRAITLNGIIEISSAPGTGTCIKIKIPVA